MDFWNVDIPTPYCLLSVSAFIGTFHSLFIRVKVSTILTFMLIFGNWSEYTRVLLKYTGTGGSLGTQGLPGSLGTIGLRDRQVCLAITESSDHMGWAVVNSANR